MRKAKEQRKKAVGVVRMLALLLLLLPVSCINDKDDDEQVATYSEGTVGVEMTIQTRAISSTSETYVVGSEWENYIDIAGGDYRIYFFTNDKDDATATSDAEKNTLIAEFVPTDILSLNGTYTTYYLSGEVDEAITAYEDFKVVVLANWGDNYPEGTVTTIDDLVEGTTATYSAFVDNGTALMPSSMLHIPFFGVHEYSGVTWKSGWRTNLSGAITLLRAVAKVEVIITEDSEVDNFDDVSIVNYNATGYCAPTNVYLKSDYDHGYIWGTDFVDALHLVGDKNDSESKTMSMQKTAATTTTQETWTCYLTEYANLSSDGSVAEDFSYISVTIDGEPYQIYFSNYTAGEASTTADYDIYRNYLYRYNVSVNSLYLYVTIDVLPWVERLDNITFGGTTASEGTEGEDTNN